MTADHALTVAASTVLAVTVTACAIAFTTATPAPRQVIQSSIPTLAEQYLNAWNAIKESP